MLSILRSNYRLVVPYIIIVMVSWALRSTPLNSCGVVNDSGACFGQVDFFLLLLSFPGWLTWLLVNLLPDFIRVSIMGFIIQGLNNTTAQFNYIFIPSSFFITAVIMYILGVFINWINPPELSEETL